VPLILWRMNGDRYEFGAIPLVGALLGVLFLVFAASVLGLGWFVALGFALLIAAAAAVYVIAGRRGQSSEPVERVAVDAADEVYRVLVVTQTTLTPALAEQLAARSSGRPAEAFVVAPRTGSRLAQWTNDEGTYASAQDHLDLSLSALTRAGLAARGQVGPLDPIQALDDGLREFSADEVVFAADGNEAFEQRVLDAARTHYAGPVSSVVVDSAAV
jgi:hypothetical protein